MTKEIIIDGVDVAGCIHLSFVEETYCCDCQYEKYALCQGYNCYYKQLKRLEQENEILKEEVKIKDNISEDFRKKALEWAEIANNYFKENSRLYKVLQEIKEIAEIGMHCEGVGCDFMPKILDLITKAEEE